MPESAVSHTRPYLAHLGIFVIDIDRMERFYTETFGLLVTDRGVGAVFRNQLVFLSGTPDQHHQLVLSSGRSPDTPSTVMQLSFKVPSLASLREHRNRALEQGATEPIGLNHGNAWSIYCYDPEGNRVEIYLDTPFHTPQPCGEPLDLDKSDEEIFEITKDIIARLPGGMPRAEYIDSMRAKLA
ncbi:VOC family protein [Brevundimonas sp.]|uniref:VOC family protein n=1 Tax=Brevundimonas sp. TaxID=1871086 RepID=UPI003D0F82E2